MKLNELMELCTNLQSIPKTNQALEITSLKRRVKKLEQKKGSRTHKLKRLYKVGLTAMVDSSKDEQSLGEDASKQERRIHHIDADEDITLVNDQDDAEMFDVNNLHGEEVFVEKEVVDKEVSTTGEVNAANIATTASAAAKITTEEITLAQSLVEIKTANPKVKGIVLQEPITTAGTRVKTAKGSYYCQYKEITDAQVEFWFTVMTKTINGKAQIHAQVDGKEIIITESSVRRDFRLEDEEYVDCLPNSTIYENLELMGDEKGFSGRIIDLFSCMLVQNLMGKGSALPTDPQHTPTILQSSSSQLQTTQKPRKPKRKNTQVPQPSGSTEYVIDKAVYKELDNRLATPNESSSPGTTLGGGPRFQEAMRDTITQTRFENVFKISNDSLLARARVDSSKDEQSLGEDASKQGRIINDIDADEDITLVNDQNDAKMFDVNDLQGEEVFVIIEDADKKVNATGEVNAASIATTTKLSEPITTTTTKTISLKQSQDKGKGIMVEEPVKLEKKDQIRLDEEAALKLQAEFDEEKRLARERAQKETEANIALIDT
uniref:Uncharacterized protein n=1 Tax=Tanacetum cinerariifolium TaxID=118510 RepID=A0A6L2MN12_TANCI|nr:hypothetical protein [Tanacetum cinerariifolium]